MKKEYWTKETLSTLIGRRNGQLTVRAVGETVEPIRLTVLETQCSCGVKRRITWLGFVTARSLACEECLDHRRKLAARRKREEARKATLARLEKAQVRRAGHPRPAPASPARPKKAPETPPRPKKAPAQPPPPDRRGRAYLALSSEQRELVDLIVNSRNYGAPEPGFRDRVVIEAIEIVKMESPESIRAEYGPKKRRNHADLYEVRTYAY